MRRCLPGVSVWLIDTVCGSTPRGFAAAAAGDIERVRRSGGNGSLEQFLVHRRPMSATFEARAWLAFAFVFAISLGVDIVAHRGDRRDSRRTAVIWSAVWVTVGIGFGLALWPLYGSKPARDYVGAYLLEKSLSLDNLLVFYVVFGTLDIPEEHHRKPLTWGIVGALGLRALFIFLGVTAIEAFHWVVYIFGGLLLLAAWRTYREDPGDKQQNKAVKWLSGHLPLARHTHGGNFFARENGALVATPLLIAMLGLELSDIVFAIDSVPAAFSVTRQPFILYSSNAFAILGLRALYMVLATSLGQLRYLHYGLAAVLSFAAIKLMIAEWIEIPTEASIGVIAAALGISIWASLHDRRRPRETAAA